MYLSFAEFAYNNTTHTSTGFSPFYVVYQRHIYSPIDIALSDISLRNHNAEALLTTYSTLLEQVRKQLDNARIKMIMQNKSNDKPSPFNVDDMVLIHRTAFRNFSTAAYVTKFDDRWIGPFPIIEVINHNAYKIEFPKTLKAHNVINISYLRPFKISLRFQRFHPDNLLLPPVEYDDDNTTKDVSTSITSSSSSTVQNDVSIHNDMQNDDEYEVETILNCRLNRNHPQQHRKLPLQQQIRLQDDPKEYDYLVKWKGYPSYEATWELYEHLDQARDVYNSFILEHHLPNS